MTGFASSCRDARRCGRVDAVQQVHRRRVHGGVVGEPPAERVLDEDPGRLADGIRDARFVADRDRDIETAVVEATESAVLRDRVDELVQHALGFVLGQVRFDPVHVPRTDAGDRDTEKRAHGRGDRVAARVGKPGAGRDLESMHHRRNLRNAYGSQPPGIEQYDSIDTRY
jgi:hypothetical protein